MMTLKKLTSISSVILTLVAAHGYAEPATDHATKTETHTLATVAAIDKSEILVAIIAKHKHPSPDVADFVKMMIDQHGENLSRLFNMVEKVGAEPLQSSTADKIRADNTTDMAKLGNLNGQAFDHAYVAAMVAGHQAGLNLIDTQLMKTATTPEIKRFMLATRAMVAHHLAEAKALEAKLKKS